MKLKYLFYCKHCGHLVIKSEGLNLFPARMECPECKKYLVVPDDLIVRMSSNKKVEMKKAVDDKTIC